MNESVPSQFHDEADPQLVEYRAVSVAAVLGLLLGLSAPLAMLAPLLWVIPAIGIAVSLWALRSIAASDGALAGRAIALAGLALSIIFGAAAASAIASEAWWLRREAQPVAAHWFALLRDDQPQQAQQLILPPAQRQPAGADLWDYYRNATDARESLERFVADPLVHALLALGPKAEVRYYGTQGHGAYDDKQQVSQYYAITYPENDRRHTFFARLVLERSLDPTTGAARWQVAGYEGGVEPYSWVAE